MERHEREKATVRITRRLHGEYGMHGSTKWDDYPYWHTYTIWDVDSKYLDLKKEIFPKSRRFWDDTETKEDAEQFALELALELENKGLEVRLEFLEEKEND